MLLVLVILLLTAALVWPSLDAAFVNYELRQAAELVRANLTSARVHAIDDGVVYEFRFDPASGSFSVAPVEDTAIESDVASSSGPWQVEDVLPGNVTFAAESALSPAGSGAVVPNEDTGADGSRAVFFYPDGMTDDATLVLSNNLGASVDLALRGLTGVVSVSDVRTGTGEQ